MEIFKGINRNGKTRNYVLHPKLNSHVTITFSLDQLTLAER